MDLEGIKLGEISQTKENKYCMLSLTGRMLKKKKVKQKQEVEKWLPGTGRRGMGSRENKKSLVKRRQTNVQLSDE